MNTAEHHLPTISPDLGGSENGSESSSEDVTEDEHGDELTPALDAAMLRTLGRIKRREEVYGTEDVLNEALRDAEARAGALKVQSRGISRKNEKACFSYIALCTRSSC